MTYSEGTTIDQFTLINDSRNNSGPLSYKFYINQGSGYVPVITGVTCGGANVNQGGGTLTLTPTSCAEAFIEGTVIINGVESPLSASKIVGGGE
jgi:hypothetical protein